MGLTICNGSSFTVSVALGWPRSQCTGSGGGWIVRGWWNVAPGQCRRLYNGTLRNFKRMAYFARTTDRSVQWGGRFCTSVSDQAFEHCWNHSTRDGRNYRACFRLIEINNREDFTLRLNR